MTIKATDSIIGHEKHEGIITQEMIDSSLHYDNNMAIVEVQLLSN